MFIIVVGTRSKRFCAALKPMAKRVYVFALALHRIGGYKGTRTDGTKLRVLGWTIGNVGKRQITTTVFERNVDHTPTP